MSQTRWFDWMKGMQWWTTWWHLRLCCLLFMCLTFNWMGKESDSVIAACVQNSSSASSSSRPATTAQAKTDTASLRDRCKNSIHTVVVNMSDRQILCYARALLFATESHHEWYSKTNHEVRDRQSAMQMHSDMALGRGVLAPVWKMMGWVSDFSKVELCGFFVSELQNMSALPDWAIGEQDAMAQNVLKLMWSLLECRIASLIPAAFIWPRAFAGLLSCHPADVEESLRLAKQAFDSFRAAATSTLPLMKAITRDSFMNWTLNIDLFGDLEKVGFAFVPPVVTEKLRTLFQNFGGTIINEIGFQRCRRTESERPEKMTCAKSWYTCIEQGVLTNTLGFREVQADIAPENVSRSQRRTPEGVHLPKHRNQSVPLKDIVGVGKPRWPSFTPDSMRSLAEHWQAIALHSGDLGKVERCWRSVLLRPGLLLFHKHLLGQKLWFSCGCYSHACLLWPAVVVKQGGARLWALGEVETFSDLKWVAVDSFSDWMPLPTQWHDHRQTAPRARRLPPPPFRRIAPPPPSRGKHLNQGDV